MLGVNFRSSSSSFPSPPRSALHNGLLQNILNVSPRISSHTNPIFQLEMTIPDQASRYWDPTKAVGGSSIISIPSNGTPTPKSSAELRKEIATLEVEILHLERYLLSLYRTAFEEQISTLSNTTATELQYKTGSSSPIVSNQSHYRLEPHVPRGGFVHHDQTPPAHDWEISDTHSCPASLKATSTRDHRNSDSGHHSLADLLGASHIDDNLCTPDRLSEDIVRCISSIYCKLANGPYNHAGFTASPTSSLSSSSIFSSKNPCDSWSPHCNENATVRHQLKGLKEESGPHAAMVEVLKICLDDDSFNYAATMLQKFRSLVRSLEKVDPRKMKREEKLAFWINIHNALVMHAYLAYGTRNHVKSTSILKAAYNVGGHCIDAYVIQNSILGIRPHHSAPWLQTLFSPGRKLKAGSARHVYALEYPEPLVHFALCSGAYSDPVVRVYTAKNIFKDLRVAKEEFIQASVYIHKETKIFLPKILQYFAKDMSLDMPGLLEVITGCLLKVQQKAIRECMKGRHDSLYNNQKYHTIHLLVDKKRKRKIQFVLLLSRQGKVRLTKWYSPYSQKERAKVIRELSGVIMNRGPKLCNFVEWRGDKVVYRRYAGLYFCMCINQDDNELEILDVIHHYVEILDRHFGSVCELDLIFNFHKAYYILDELLIAGELQESSKKTVLRLIDAQDALVEIAKEQASVIGNIIAQVTK